MSPLGWFLLGVVAGALGAVAGWCVWIGYLVARGVKRSRPTQWPKIDRHNWNARFYYSGNERGGRVRVGER